MDRETLGEFFEGRTWGVCALILVGLNIVWFVLTVQVFGGLDIHLDYARRTALPHWASLYMRVTVLSLLPVLPVGVVGLVLDKRKVTAWLAVTAFLFLLPLYGSAFE